MMKLLLVLLVFSAEGGPLMAEASNRTDQLMNVYRRETPALLQHKYLSLPMYMDSDLPLVHKEYFSPARGTGQEPLPGPVRELLLPVMPDTSPPSMSAVTVKTSCELNKMQLQVDRSILGFGDPVSHLKLGTCQVSRTTEHHLLFEYELEKCGTKRTMIGNRMVYFNLLHYDPPKRKGPIRRMAPLKLPIACYFNRFVYSYKIGYTPKVQMRKVLKKMRNSAKFVLTPQTAEWKETSQPDYVLGEPMFFEAKAESLSNDERLYIHTCYATSEKSHTSKPQYPVIKNSGCMVESKSSHSRFIPHRNNAVRFSVDAFLFKGMAAQLYMHCTMFVGSLVPTPTAKSCNYDSNTRRWVELFGPNSVCDCCDSSCGSEESAEFFPETPVMSSTSWTINPKTKVVLQLKKKMAPTTSTTTGTSWKSLPVDSADLQMGGVGEVGEAELDWPFRGGGVTWMEEKEVKGSAVGEEEEEEEGVSKPRRVFEDIFDFDELSFDLK
nr:zona pellucida sperm-binding protein 3d.2 [Nothobranchius furzeri]